MNRSNSCIAAWWVLGSGLSVSAIAKPPAPPPPEPGFWLTGFPPGTNLVSVTSLTKDGSVAAGWAGGLAVGPGFTWTQSGGRSDFGLLPGMPIVSSAYGLSDNGVVAGVTSPGDYQKSRAYRWKGSGALQDLGLLPGETRSFAHGIDGSGTVVVGHAEHGPNTNFTGQAFRWTPTSGMQSIGKLTPGSLLSKALAVSRDGKTIVGENHNEFLNTDAFVWTQATGMKALPKLGNPSNTATADAVNADGSVIVGRSVLATGGMHMVRWKGGMVEDLSVGPPFANSWGLTVSDTGEVVAGTNDGTIAIVWTPPAGVQTAGDYLKTHGVRAPVGYQLEYIYAVSSDGRTFGGQARDLSTGLREGFVATIPDSSCKADCDASGELDIDDFICFQTRFAISDPYADCDASGSLDIEDFICFQTAYAIGC